MSHMGTPRIRTHAQALALFNNRPKIRGTDERNPGKPTAKNRRMRLYEDGSVGFIYYKHELIRYHPDDTITMTAFDRLRWGEFCNQVVPYGLHQDIGTRAGPIIYLARNKANYPARDHTNGEPSWYWWSATNEEKQVAEMRVVKGVRPVHLHVVKGCWRPVDESALDLFEWSALDKKKAREAAALSGIRDFKPVTDMIRALSGALPDYVGENAWRGTQSREAYVNILNLIEARDYSAALAHMRRDSRWVYDPVARRSVQTPEQIVSTELDRVRTALYLREGAVTEYSGRVLTFKEYNAMEAALKRFA